LKVRIDRSTPAGGEHRSGRAQVLGVDCFAGDLDAATDAVVARALTGEGGYACLANVHVLVSGQRDPAVRSALSDAWTVFPDGAPVAWLQRREGWRAATRIGGPDLMPRVLDHGTAAGLRHFLFGSTPDTLAALASRLLRTHPGIELVGTWAPPLGEEHSASSIERIVAAGPQIVWVALGAPKQECWMHRHADEIAPAIALGVGAAFDFLAGSKRRAPSWMQRAGLEWAHRLAMEPRRLGPRYLRTNTEFVVRAGRALAATGRDRQSRAVR
jgi:N-acetylglucosaminyldiphosphoundecaprenol N-acetyl-beta-D-mannosaminyltransferase